MNAKKLNEATQRLETLYWNVLLEGVGPSCELLAILRLLQDAATAADAGTPDDEEVVYLTEEPPAPAA